ncbi:hypothetical protein BALAC2494_02030 [Bifidobacterium animalis subsp. lactis CNCM I-2494]|uniref:Uncharacterized protein n=1 Tax=Bifidobacterium animalis subsp. lactis CNCM I-2494 TaxID=1042403 RepID=A0A806FNZ4_BIFAN|nr:hypothetical protein BALAC2494_02030 [Bifidobacterium animalis subsp. lactis CNCM I-2494]
MDGLLDVRRGLSPPYPHLGICVPMDFDDATVH